MNTISEDLKPAPFRQTLVSAERGIDLIDWILHAKDVGLDEAAEFTIHKRRLHGGRQAGVDLVEIRAGTLAITVIPTRGMGILQVVSKQLRLGWNSPVRQVIHPQFIHLQSRGGLGWLEGFNEWLVRCGLEFAGAPGQDRFKTNTGSISEMELTLHGKIANIPASEVELVIDRVPPYTIRLRGRVDEFMFYGPKLELWTELSLSPGSNAFRIEDTITNRAGADQEFELIYHVNFGAPLLEAGTMFQGAIGCLTPMNAHAAKAMDEYARYQGPTTGFVEQVYCMELLGDAQQRTTVLLRNQASDRAASMTWSLDQLPCFTLWKNTNQLEEGYVTGLEPGTSFPRTRSLEREAGRVPKLRAGESRRFTVDYGIHTAADEVQRVSQAIARLQKHAPKINAAPLT